MRYLKALGLALVAAFAMSAVVASAASAQNQGLFTSETGEPFTLTIEETGEAGANGLTLFGDKVECPGTAYTGHKVDETPHELIETGETAITITRHHGTHCTTGGGLTMTIDTTGCDFEFYDATTTGEAAGTYVVKTALACPEESTGIHTYIYSGSHEQTPICTLTATAGGNQELTGLHLTNSDGHVVVTGSLNNIHVDRSGLCLLDGKGNTTSQGKLHIDATVNAHDEEGEPVGVTSSDE